MPSLRRLFDGKAWGIIGASILVPSRLRAISVPGTRVSLPRVSWRASRACRRSTPGCPPGELLSLTSVPEWTNGFEKTKM